MTKKVIGIIAEYNTFHHGHKLQLELAKNSFSADYIIIVMSGDFTQRGTPAIIDKYQRAQSAVYYGADLVIELPVCCATADLPEFALGGVSILNQLGVVDHILFGSECGDISSVQAIAEMMCTDSYKAAYCELMRAGYASPEARAKAVKGLLGGADDYGHIVNEPNNLLGIQYLCALKQLSSNIIPLTHLRKGQAYLDESLPNTAEQVNTPVFMASASAIRRKLMDIASQAQTSGEYHPNTLDDLQSYMPAYILESLKKEYGHSFPIFSDDFSEVLKYRMLLENIDSLAQINGISRDFARSIKECIFKYRDYESFCGLLISHEAKTRIDRRLFRLITNQTSELLKAFINDQVTYYARVLTRSARSQTLIEDIRSNSSIPLILNPSLDGAALAGHALRQFENDITASHVYESIVATKFRQLMKCEWSRVIQ